MLSKLLWRAVMAGAGACIFMAGSAWPWAVGAVALYALACCLQDAEWDGYATGAYRPTKSALDDTNPPKMRPVTDHVPQVISTYCEARQHSDQMYCSRCGTAWDMNDPAPPPCPWRPL